MLVIIIKTREDQLSDQVRWVGEDAIFIANALPKPEDLKGI